MDNRQIRSRALAFIDAHDGATQAELCAELQADPRKISHFLWHACQEGILEREFENKHGARYFRIGMNLARPAKKKKVEWHGEKAGPVYCRQFANWGGFQRMAGIVNRGRG